MFEVRQAGDSASVYTRKYPGIQKPRPCMYMRLVKKSSAGATNRKISENGRKGTYAASESPQSSNEDQARSPREIDLGQMAEEIGLGSSLAREEFRFCIILDIDIEN